MYRLRTAAKRQTKRKPTFLYPCTATVPTAAAALKYGRLKTLLRTICCSPKTLTNLKAKSEYKKKRPWKLYPVQLCISNGFPNPWVLSWGSTSTTINFSVKSPPALWLSTTSRYTEMWFLCNSSIASFNSSFVPYFVLTVPIYSNSPRTYKS